MEMDGLPRDTRPLSAEDLIQEDYELLAKIERAVAAVLQDCDEHPRASSYESGWPWATLDPDRTPRVMMIDGERGTGKTSLMLTLLRGWQDGALGDGKVEATVDGGSWPDPTIAPRVRALAPLDFDPLPPSLPLLAWIVQAFKPVVDWAVGRYVEPRWRGLSQLDEAQGTPESRLSARWQRLHDDAAIAWQVPGSPEPFEAGEDQLRRVRKWSQFEREWQQFLDALMERLQQVQAWGRRDQPGILVLPIDDVDMQITRAPELIRALRLLHHRRLVFLLTGDAALLDHVLQLDFDGQRARLLAPLPLGSRNDKPVARDLGARLVEKVVRLPLRFPLRRLNLRRALEWRQQALVRAAGSEYGWSLPHVVLGPETSSAWRDLISITYRQLTDLERRLAQRPREQRRPLLFDLFAFRDKDLLRGESSEVQNAGMTEGLEGVIRAVADEAGRVRLYALPIRWRILEDHSADAGAQQLQLKMVAESRLSRGGDGLFRPLDRWLELWGLVHQDDASNQPVRVSWEGFADGAVIRTAIMRNGTHIPWPSPWFAEWAGASADRRARWNEEHARLEEFIEEEFALRGLSSSTSRNPDERPAQWEAVLCGWIRHLQPQDAQTRPKKGKTHKPSGERLRELLRVPLTRKDGRRSDEVDGHPSALALAHEVFGLPLALQRTLTEALWPLWPAEEDPSATDDEAVWERRWQAIGTNHSILTPLLSILEHDVPLDRATMVAAEEAGVEAELAVLLGSMAEAIRQRTLLTTPLGMRVALEVSGPGAWLAQTLGQIGFVNTQATRQLTFLSEHQEPRDLAMMLLLPATADRWSGASIWKRTGYAAEAMGRAICELGVFPLFAQAMSDGVRERGWSATQLVAQVYQAFQNAVNVREMERRRLKDGSAALGVGSAARLWVDSTGMLGVQPPRLTARLVSAQDAGQGASKSGTLELFFDKRWTFECAAFQDLPIAERHALGAWLQLATDICREQGNDDSVEQVDVILDNEVWVRVDGRPWPAPPLTSFTEIDLLRLRLSSAELPNRGGATADSKALLHLTVYIDLVFRIALERWGWIVRPTLAADVDRLWQEGGALSIWRAFSSLGASGTDSRRRVHSLAQWWTKIRPSLEGVLGKRIAARLKIVDEQAKGILGAGI